MSDEVTTADLGVKPISYTDEFRRAKRNSLVWSSLTILACLGTAASPGAASTWPTAIAVVPLGIHLDRSVIIASVAMAAVFFAVGYVRSMQLVNRLSSELVLSSAFHDLVNALRKLEIDAGFALQESKDVTEQAHIFKKNIRDAKTAYFRAIQSAQEQSMEKVKHFQAKMISNVAKLIMKKVLDSGVGMADENRRFIENIVFDAIYNDLNRWSKDIAQTLFSGTDDHLVQNLIPNISTDVLNSQVSMIGGLADQLDAFSRKIGFGDRWWYYIFDHGVIAALFGIAMVLAGLEFCRWG
jgi:ribosomal protein L17